jgi:uncharacterized protein YecT (DUF1311 family)
MRNVSFLVICLLSLHCFSQDSTKCKYKAIDAQLNKVYTTILQEYKNDTLFIKRFKEAQRAWLQFRDAQLESRFPTAIKGNQNKEYGSMYPECACFELAELTKQRVTQLEAWLNGTEEGDVCGGSYRIKTK